MTLSCGKSSGCGDQMDYQWRLQSSDVLSLECESQHVAAACSRSPIQYTQAVMCSTAQLVLWKLLLNTHGGTNWIPRAVIRMQVSASTGHFSSFVPTFVLTIMRWNGSPRFAKLGRCGGRISCIHTKGLDVVEVLR
jgi:hypothetical protein